MSGNIEGKDPWKRIKEFYLSVPFGSMPKTNIDAFIYGLLEEEGFFAGCKTTQDIAIKLRIQPTKVRNLMLNSVLQKGLKVEEYTNNILDCLGSSATITENNYIKLCINNSIVKTSLQMVCANNKILTDESFNEEILIFPIKDFAKLLEIFVPKGKEKELDNALWKRIKDRKWQITKKQIANNPITKILIWGAKSVAKSAIDGAIPTNLIVGAIKDIIANVNTKLYNITGEDNA